MSQINTLQTEGYFIRINYWDQDVSDRQMSSETQARHGAEQASNELKADADVCKGATVLATYRNGKEI